MFDGLLMFGHALARFSDPVLIAYALGATLLGIIVGVIPGLSATLVIALLTTLTIKQPPGAGHPDPGVRLRGRDLRREPLGDPAQHSRHGGERGLLPRRAPARAARRSRPRDGHLDHRLGAWARCSACSAWRCSTPTLGEMALKFGAFEYFWLALVGVLMSGTIAGADPLKGWLMGLAGLVAALVGQDGMHAVNRMTFGVQDLEGGISLIPALVGAFGFSEVLLVLASRSPPPMLEHRRQRAAAPARRAASTGAPSSAPGTIGVLVGILPGVGEDVAAWSSYAAARRASREKERSARARIEGLMAAETGDNASIPGAIIPALSLGIPGSAPSAVLMAAMIIHGAQPGPMLMINQPEYIYEIVAITLVATLSILVFGLIMVRPLLLVLRVPRTVIMPIIFVLCVVGAFAIAVAAVRRVLDARHRRRRLRAAPRRLSDGALRARARARRHPGQEPAPRPDADRRRPDAVLHAADQRRAGGRDHLSLLLLHPPCAAFGRGAPRSLRWPTHVNGMPRLRLALCNEVLRDRCPSTSSAASPPPRLHGPRSGAVHARPPTR